MGYFTLDLGLTEEQNDQIETFIRKNFVTRAHYDKKIAEQDAKIEELSNLSKESSENKKAYEKLLKDYDALKLQNEKKDSLYQDKIKEIQLDYAMKDILKKEGAKDVQTVRIVLQQQLQGKEIQIQEDGTIPGLLEQIQSMKKSPSTNFLFYEDKLQGTGSTVPENETKEVFTNENPSNLDELSSRMSQYLRYIHPPKS